MATAKEKQKSDKPDRIIALIQGESGEGKSFFVGQLKNALIYDTDLGGGLGYLEARIKKNGSERVELSSYRDILADLRRRAKDGNLPQSVAIDHVTQLHQEAILRYNPTQERDFGNSGNRATYEWRQLREFIRTFDCNLFCVSHLKGKWEGEKVNGTVADGAKNIEGDMHIVLKVMAGRTPEGAKVYPAKAQVMKWRRDPDDERGPVPPSFAWTLEEFSRIHGANYSREREKVEFAKPETVAELVRVLEFLGAEKSNELSTKWLAAAAVDKFQELTEAQALKCIQYVKDQVNTNGEKKS